MLGKLLKSEFKSTGRVFLPLYGLLLLSSIIAGFLWNTDSGFFQIISNTIFTMLCCTVFVGTAVILIQRFNNNLLKQEGYLMLTLPVKSSSIVWSKLIAAIVWSILSTLVGMLSFVLLVSLSNVWNFNLWDAFVLGAGSLWQVLASITAHEYWVIFVSGLLLFVMFVVLILTVYLSLSVGQLKPFTKHRKLWGCVAFLLIYIIQQSLCFNTPVFAAYPTVSSLTVFLPYLYFYLTANLIFAAGIFVAIVYILKNHLNLE